MVRDQENFKINGEREIVSNQTRTTVIIYQSVLSLLN